MDSSSKTTVFDSSFGTGIWRPWEKSLLSPCQIKPEPQRKWTKKCPKCDEIFTRRDNLTRHIKTKHEARSKPTCIFCNKSLSRPDALARHIKTCQRNPSRGRSQSYSPPPSPCDSPKDLTVRVRPSVIVSRHTSALGTHPRDMPSPPSCSDTDSNDSITNSYCHYYTNPQ